MANSHPHRNFHPHVYGQNTGAPLLASQKYTRRHPSCPRGEGVPGLKKELFQKGGVHSRELAGLGVAPVVIFSLTYKNEHGRIEQPGLRYIDRK